MTDKTMDDDAVEASTDKTQNDEVKTFTQEDMTATAARAAAKAVKQFEGVDVSKYNAMIDNEAKAERKKQVDKGEFEQILEEQASKHKTEIAQYKTRETEYNINSPIINAAAKHQAINPEQVRSLIKGDFRLGDNGVVEVVDKEGKARYNDDGKPFTVDDRVSEFLDSNAHFVQANPSTTNTQTNHDATVTGDLDITKLDMKNPNDRAKYKAHKEKRGIA